VAEAAEIAVLAPAPGPYTYAVPPDLIGRLRTGVRVLVPLAGQAAVEGVVLRLALPGEAEKRTRRLRPISSLIDGPPVPAELLGLISFIAEYYLSPIGEALRLALPPHQQAQLLTRIALTERGAELSPQTLSALLPAAAAELSSAQQTVLVALAGLLRSPLSSRRRQTVDLPTLQRALPALAAPKLLQALRSLRESGLVELAESVAAGVAEKQELWAGVRAAPPSEEEQRYIERSLPRASLFRHLLRFGPLPLSDLRVLSPRARSLVKQLQEAGLVELTSQTVRRDPLLTEQEFASVEPDTPPVLTAEQERALAPLLAALDGGYCGFLLHGVTGSGKTELYLRLIAAALLRGKSALVLVPEIALTPQLAARFVARFGPKVAVLHSGLTQGQRADVWRRIVNQDDEVRIALGPRSALFAPLSDLGVVIVDEEHDSSFKQQDGVRYHGRDVALVRAQRAGAVAVLGSATPSLESLALARRGKLQLLTLTERATGLPMPTVAVIDLKQHILPEDQALLSAPLERALGETLAAGEQSLLFLNRRGYATFLLCQRCGHRLECRHCAVTLTWHKARERLLCHYCGYSETPTELCPLCGAAAVTRLGLGTEKLAEQIVARFPTARVARLDRDTASELRQILAAMHRREIDILIGTQMLTKGHDFPGVTLVGVVLADTGMGLPDFRAGERTFQLLAQVAGRAGRRGRAGRVLIQTYNPEHPAVVCALTHDYTRFAEAELAARTALGYAPSMRIGLLRVDGPDPLQVRDIATLVSRRVADEIARLALPVFVQGPAEAPLSRLKGRTRWQLLLRAKTSQALRTVLWAALKAPLPRGVRLHADIDPASTL
jgi:primosomal protein N' (replication factor Y)